MDKKILVTGSDGFIGSHLTEELVKRDIKLEHSCIIIPLIIGGGLIHYHKK